MTLTRRETPELYEDPIEAAQSNHANAIRSILLDFGANAVFCIQGVPTVVIVCLDSYDEKHVVDLHGMLWNQGLATLLLILSDDMLRVFSLARKPYLEDANFVKKCMAKEINLVADALEARNLIYSVESGRFWEEYSSFFKPNERIDQVLLANLTQSYKELKEEGLANENAQALLIQTMFIAYLEDREVIGPDYVKSASRGERNRLQEILDAGDTKSFYELFRCLKDDFNDDLFLAPCAFDPDEAKPRVTRAHLSTLAAFRSGQEEMDEGVSQLLFLGLQL